MSMFEIIMIVYVTNEAIHQDLHLSRTILHVSAIKMSKIMKQLWHLCPENELKIGTHYGDVPTLFLYRGKKNERIFY